MYVCTYFTKERVPPFFLLKSLTYTECGIYTWSHNGVAIFSSGNGTYCVNYEVEFGVLVRHSHSGITHGFLINVFRTFLDVTWHYFRGLIMNSCCLLYFLSCMWRTSTRKQMSRFTFDLLFTIMRFVLIQWFVIK